MEILKRPFYYRFSMILLMLISVAIILKYGSDIIVPFAFAALLAVLLVPMNNYLERKRLSRPTSIFASLAVSSLFIFGIIYFLSIQILAFVDDIPIIKERINEIIYSVQRWLHQRFGLSMREQSDYINTAKISSQANEQLEPEQLNEPLCDRKAYTEIFFFNNLKVTILIVRRNKSLKKIRSSN